MVVIVMGVAGSGKTTVGERLARELGWEFVEGDELHSEANRAKMAAGVALEDEDRWEWLGAVRREIERVLGEGKSAVVACSALKRAYREVLRRGIESQTRVVYLRIDEEEARRRVAKRRGHAFPVKLVESQFAALERPRGEEGVVEVDGTRGVEEIVREVGEIANSK